MKINRNNYEAYFIDYLEGNLDEKLVNDFIEFIQQNPDLKAEMELFNSVSLEPEDLEFAKKDRLYKEKFDVENTFNHAAIAQLEGDLNEAENADFENYLSKHPEKQKEAALFAQTKLTPDESVQFPKKSRLYHRHAGRTFLLWAGRVAAVLVLAVSVYFFLDNSSENIPENKVAVVKENNQEQEKQVPENTAENKTAQKATPETEKQPATPSPAHEQKAIAQPVQEKIKNQPEQQLLAENATEKTTAKQTTAQRIQSEIPAKINTLSAQVKTQKPQAVLASVDRFSRQNLMQASGKEERLIGDVVREKAGLDNLSLNKITKAGLKLVSSISKENFTYETNSNGDVTEVNFDSRLLAFSIPTNNGE